MTSRNTPFARFTERQRDLGGEAWTSEDLDHEVVTRLQMQLRPGPEAAGEGRHALDRLEEWMPEEQLNELRLLVSELLTNSVRHGNGGSSWIKLQVDVCRDSVRVVVSDQGPGFRPEPAPRPHTDRPGGWGLCLVDRLTDRWGVDLDGETRVWFELDRGAGDFAATG